MSPKPPIGSRALVQLASPLGLYSEEMDPTTRAHLGNSPQALSHAALVQAALALRDARSGAVATPSAAPAQDGCEWPHGRGRGEHGREDDRDRDDDEHRHQRERRHVRDREAVGEPSPEEAPADDAERDPDHQADDGQQRRLPRDREARLAASEADRPEDGEVVPAATHRGDERVADRRDGEQREEDGERDRQ